MEREEKNEENDEDECVRWWKNRGPYGSNFNVDFEKIDEIVEEIMKNGMKGLDDQPLVFGISLKSGPDGIPKVSEFGNARDFFVHKDEGREWTPLTDVQVTEDDVLVTVDVPGVEKEDIDLQVMGRELIINVDGARKYKTRVKLPVDVETEDADATYRNGVLEVKLKKMGDTTCTRIDVE